MSIIDSLIVDRTEADKDEVLRIRNKILYGGITSLTDAERTAWLGGMKGSYNYTDLNRVGQAVNYLRDELADVGIVVNVSGKTDWRVEDEVSLPSMDTYLQNINALKSAIPITTESTPDTMRWLTIEKMNTIEKILCDIRDVINSIKGDLFSSGELICGEY